MTRNRLFGVEVRPSRLGAGYEVLTHIPTIDGDPDLHQAEHFTLSAKGANDYAREWHRHHVSMLTKGADLYRSGLPFLRLSSDEEGANDGTP
ncbi:hypothetical protein [Novosphingobium sp. CECT 9465]|uniref:hypothetical protein n=1 Tax=Novosphingobium sp. CECT 9465 TaxID=2829794 RepID=UPI001E4DD9CB|nr:hypothetical protein [Novosphingobium sp. CECT 9465]CAH0496618.1 hypothetical protein NVSP9465_01655 [Novosphingobium sp. CECT 9465]